MAVLLLIFAAILSMKVVAAAKISPLIILHGNDQETCPSTEQLNVALQKIRDNIYLNVSILPQCGEGIWYRVAYLNMTDPSQQCPSAWRQYSGNQYRACGRPVSGSQSSPATFYTTNCQYSKVCGRITALQFASPDGFQTIYNIDHVYMDGVSITYGSPRNHISSEMNENIYACPCDSHFGTPPQSFVGSDYYCESGNPNQEWRGRAYPDNKLYGMESSVVMKAHAALVPTLHHGSV